MTVKKRFISSFAHRTLVSRQSLFSPRSPALPDSWEKKNRFQAWKSCSAAVISMVRVLLILVEIVWIEFWAWRLSVDSRKWLYISSGLSRMFCGFLVNESLFNMFSIVCFLDCSITFPRQSVISSWRNSTAPSSASSRLIKNRKLWRLCRGCLWILASGENENSLRQDCYRRHLSFAKNVAMKR